jgi:hypothetical protein
MSWTRLSRVSLTFASLISACAFQQPPAPPSSVDSAKDTGSVGTSADTDASTGAADAAALEDLVGAEDIEDASGEVDVALSDQADTNTEGWETASGCEGRLGPCNCNPTYELCPCDPKVDTNCCRTDHQLDEWVCTSYGANGYFWGGVADGCDCYYPNLPDHCKKYLIYKHPGYCGLPPNP